MPVQRVDSGKLDDGRHKMRNPALELKRAQKRILKRRRELGSWRAVGREMGLSAGTLIRISQGYEPKSSHIRNILGLPIYATVQVCPHCGKVHPPSRRHVSSNPVLLKFVREVAVPFLAARDHD